MTRLSALCLCISVVLLSACVGADPYSQIAAGQAALQATAVARSAARQATQGAINAIQFEQTQLAGEALAIQAQAKGTQEAIAYQQTALSLQDTQAASALRSTQSAATASALTLQSTIDAGLRSSHYYATQTAIPVIAGLAVSKARRGDMISWTGAFFLLGLLCLALLFLLAVIHILWLRGKAQAVFIAERARYLSTRDTPQLPPAPVARPEDNPNDDVIQLLFASASVVGKTSPRIPRHSDLPGFTPARWTTATDSLVQSGAAIKVERSGTYIRQPYKTIDGLYQAITTGRLRIQPPHPTASSAWTAARTDTEQITEQIQEYS